MGQQKTNCRGANNLGDGESANKTGGKFAGLYPEGQIPRGEPYPLPKTIVANWGSGSLPGTPTATDEHLSQGYVDLFHLLSEEWGLITHRALEGRETSGRAGKGVLGIPHPHELLAPGGGVGRDEAPKSRLQVLIDRLQLVDRLRMEPGG